MTGKKKRINIPTTTLLFIAIPVFVIIIALAKIATKESEYVYAKVKVSQGFWWGTSAKPNVWFTKAIKKGEVEYNFFGKPAAEIIQVKYYPVGSSPNADVFNIYFVVKLDADYNKKTQQYVFKRKTLAVGSPIEVITQSANITGTVIEISKQEFDDKYEEKIVTLTKKLAFPWEYDAIKIGDKYYDGEDVVFEILTKHQIPTTTITNDAYGNIISESKRYITIKARVRVKSNNERLLFGEEKVLTTGTELDVSTEGFGFNKYFVSKIE